MASGPIPPVDGPTPYMTFIHCPCQRAPVHTVTPANIDRLIWAQWGFVFGVRGYVRDGCVGSELGFVELAWVLV